MHINIFKLLSATSFMFSLIFINPSFASDIQNGDLNGQDGHVSEGKKPISQSAPTSEVTGSSSDDDDLEGVSIGSKDSHEENILSINDLQRILNLTEELNIQDPNRPLRPRDEFMAYRERSRAALNNLFQEAPIATLRTWPWSRVIQLVKDKIPHDLLTPIPGSVPYLLECRSHDARRHDRYDDEEFLRLLSAFFNYGPAQRTVWQEIWYQEGERTPEEMAVISFWDYLATAKGFPEEK